MQKNYLSNICTLACRILLLVGTLFILAGCAPSPPNNMNNACAIFQQYPRWYWDALNSYRRWGVPVSVQMAIIKQESHFRARAAPPRTKLFGFIPWSRPTSAYGYAQAVNGTWKEYIRSTNNGGADRDSFADATDFIGWYGYQVNKKLDLSKRNAFAMYLAFHEGIQGYAQKTYKRKPWLIQVAKKVERNALTYRSQIARCKYDIAKPSIWNLWLV